MRKISLYIAASLDGYIARPDGDTSWLQDERYTLEGEDFGYNSFLQTIDTTLMGNHTYQDILGFEGPFPYQGKTNYVFSRSSHPDTEYVRFVQQDPVGFVQRLRKQTGPGIWLIGGSQLNTLFLNARLIDEIILTCIPVILGDGVPLFAAGTTETYLQLQESKSYQNGFAQLTYKCDA